MQLKHIVLAALSSVAFVHLPAQAAGLTQYQAKAVSNYATTQYPLVMAHGFGLGFSRIGTQMLGLDYWYQILPDLARNGATVFAAEMSAVESTEVRGEQLLQQVDEVMALTGKKKVNLIGHSHGGPTIQYIEGVAPEKVASMTAVAGAMKGTKLADVMVESKFLDPIAEVVFGLLGKGIALIQSNPKLSVDYEGSMQSLSTTGITVFNAKYGSAAIPKDCNSQGQKQTADGIYHYSWMGNQQITNPLDVIDTSIVALGTTLLKSKDHDGLVSLCSGRYGQVIRQDYKHNHFDEINHFFGIQGIFAQDPVAIYRQHANRLKLQGL